MKDQVAFYLYNEQKWREKVANKNDTMEVVNVIKICF